MNFKRWKLADLINFYVLGILIKGAASLVLPNGLGVEFLHLINYLVLIIRFRFNLSSFNNDFRFTTKRLQEPTLLIYCDFIQAIFVIVSGKRRA